MYSQTRKNRTAALLAALVTLTATGCANEESASSAVREVQDSFSEASTAAANSTVISESSSVSDANAETITIVDHADRTVTLPREINRIAVANIYPLPSVLSVFFDSGEKIVGMPKQSMTAAQNSLLGELYPEMLGAETAFIDGVNVNYEELLALAPDVVFYSADETADVEALERTGIPCVAISASKWDYDAIATLDGWLSLLGQIFPENEKSQVCSEYSKRIYDEVQKRTSALKDEERVDAMFLFQYSDANITTSGKNFFGQYWADAIGARNVGAELADAKSAAVGMEQVYAWNPDLIFVTNYTTAVPDDLYENRIGSYDWSAVAAVQEKRVYKMPLGMYRSYTVGIDTPITLLWLAKTAYPQLFEDMDVTAETQKYYEEVFGITLTEEQANRIFAPSASASAY